MKRFHLLWLLFVPIMAFSQKGQAPDEWVIPAEANSFITKESKTAHRLSENRNAFKNSTARIGKEEILLKKETESVISTFAYMNEAAKPTLYINASGKGKLNVVCGKKKFSIKVNNNSYQKIKVGQLHVKSPGHLSIDFRLSGNADNAEISIKDIILGNVQTQPYYIGENYSAYFGRRGPSVHLQYQTKEYGEGDWTYNEVTVPEDGDVEYTYYCAQGFDCGYFGFQNNGNGVRKVLFSVWNAQDSDNPENVSEPYRAVLINKGTQTVSNEFGNEGSGKQTFIDYPWKPGNTYRFALHAEHKVPNSTDFSAYFYSPDESRWIYIATIRRPFTNFLLRGIYSFLENFHPEQGAITRRAYYHNMWFRKADSHEWTNINKVKITNDETGRIGKRVDFDGGVEDNRFYLKNCGFFGNGDLIKRNVEIPENMGKSPKEELEKLIQSK